MKQVHYAPDGRRFSVDGEIPFTHIVIGQRDEAADKQPLADAMLKTVDQRTPEERAAVAELVFKSTRGWYALKPLAWAASSEEANSLVEKFKSAGWINLEVQQVNPRHTLIHA